MFGCLATTFSFDSGSFKILPARDDGLSISPVTHSNNCTSLRSYKNRSMRLEMRFFSSNRAKQCTPTLTLAMLSIVDSMHAVVFKVVMDAGRSLVAFITGTCSRTLWYRKSVVVVMLPTGFRKYCILDPLAPCHIRQQSSAASPQRSGISSSDANQLQFHRLRGHRRSRVQDNTVCCA
jgi:hypothetical protein